MGQVSREPTILMMNSQKQNKNHPEQEDENRKAVAREPLGKALSGPVVFVPGVKRQQLPESNQKHDKKREEHRLLASKPSSDIGKEFIEKLFTARTHDLMDTDAFYKKFARVICNQARMLKKKAPTVKRHQRRQAGK